jgi:hypothetical protein
MPLLIVFLLLLVACGGKPAAPPSKPLELAKYEWRVLRDVDTARKRLRQLDTPDAHVVLARIAIERGDFAGARAEAKQALAAATKNSERRAATVVLANAIRLDPQSTDGELRETVAMLRALLAEQGPYLAPSRALVRVALRAGDGAAALEGVNGYYRGTAHPELARILPSWRGTAGERPAIARALAAVLMFEEAALVEPDGEIARYAAMLRRIEHGANEHYRRIALGDDDPDAMDDLLERELKQSKEELARLYGTYVITGQTGLHHDMHFAHVLVDRTMKIEQYGQTATVRFVALDGVVTNGYSQWLSDAASGDGGWGTGEEVFQVRPRYADGPLRYWNEPPEEDTLADRLHRQYLDRVRAETKTREEFIARVERDTFTYSIVLHEGRHAIDALSGKSYDTWELEYRAKLSEIALAPSPRQALGSVLGSEIGGDSPHGKANEKLVEELVAWMKRHGRGAALEDVVKLTDEEIAEAVRSLDPLAR